MAGAKEVQSVHPFTRWVAGLSSPMSLTDQRAAATRISHLMLTTVFVATVFGYFVGNVHTAFFAVAAACGVSLIVWGPNWYQNEDPDQRWCDENEVKKYYETLEQLRDEAKQKIIDEFESKGEKKRN
ncbi:Microsomal signal peptidase 12 kDa subunit (SPC12), putative [Trypanosoma equiperdum]|uniref:Microsomal signal peptidase 12 kDa subunit (SPC12), putative n=1 Tax=Trypanosoma equiperdum TaxID=5694 RepID=A0A1G4IE04_TRYEQ|nr:Microsomal signal peptidase 12 kDa subunit (SPC12), putative [Trypanosoma equiperdum]